MLQSLDNRPNTRETIYIGWIKNRFSSQILFTL